MINGNDEIRGIIADFKKLATKIQQDNGQVKKTPKDREVALDACKKEYQNLYYEHEALKKKDIELKQKLQRQPKQQKTTNVCNYATTKIDRFKKPRKRYYVVDDNEEDNVEAESDQEAEDEITENKSDGENNAEQIKVQRRKKNKAAVEPPKKKNVKEKNKKTQKSIIDFINN